MLPQCFNLSILLYKYLDQSWLEKLFSLGLPNKLLNLSLYGNLFYYCLNIHKIPY